MKQLATIIAAFLCLTACTAKKPETTSEQVENKKVLVAYYSATGTTKAQAEAIANAIDATLYKKGTLHMVKSLDLVDVKPLNLAGMWEIFRKIQ